MDISVKYLGLDLKNPIIIGSSGLTNSVNRIKELEKNGAAAVVLKSLFEEQISMEQNHIANQDQHNYPEFQDYVKFYTEGKNLNNYLDIIKDSKKSIDIPIIASINCVSSNEWVSFAKNIETAGADAIELNISLLPSNFDLDSSENEKIYFKIIEKVKQNVNIPIALKMSYYSAGLANLIQKLSWTQNIDSFVLFNRFYNPDIDIDKKEVISSSKPGNSDDIYTSLRWVALLSDTIELPLVASTGIHDSKDVIKQILAGAQAVQIVSSIYKKGGSYISIILEEIENWMKKNNYSKLSDFRGLLNQKKSENHSVYERIQFMKYFSDKNNI
ncbi:MAG: dihydroorotate dehydrogenase-like protein [Bacteroidales bacterium]|nr:dihydroorotate dehydrogenase-like protein [Bacteroidales bacterium]